MTISPEEAKRLANELLDDDDPVKSSGPTIKGPIGVGSQIGRYRIESLIATGGMGAVYRATHEQPTRTVALKVVRPELLSSSAVRRFRHETELLGRLQHPGIAQIFEADSVRTDLGDQPYFAMELVEGQPLLNHADDASLGTRDRLELFLKVCDAVEHAHRKGVIHRDLKPGNVLVTKDGQPKVLDFGVAKATDADIQSTTLRTDVGQLVGTLPYMSPEQVGGDAADLDTRSDVYSLGVLLYHLLSGQLPYEIKKGAVPEAVRAIQEEDPAPLSSIDKTLRGDVETIVGKALEKDRDRRYQGASDLANDIRRYLANETITARPASAWYQISKFSKRNRGIVIAGGLFAASLLLGIAGTTTGMLWAFGQKNRAEMAEQATQHELSRATEVKTIIAKMISSVSPREAKGMDTTLLKNIMDDTAKRLLSAEIKDELIQAELHALLGEVYLKLGRFDDAENHLESAVEIRTRVLGIENPSTLDVVHSMAMVHANEGRFDAAEPLYETVVEHRSRVLGEDHGETLGAMNNLAILYSEMGRYDDAERLMLKNIEVQTRVLGNENIKTLTSVSNLALLYDFQGLYEKSEPFYLRTLEIGKPALGEDHPLILNVTANMALMYKDSGRYAKAVEILEEVLKTRERILGKEHPGTLTSLSNLAGMYAKLGKYAKAEPLHLRALQERRRLLGEEHPHTLESMNGLGLLYLKQEKYKHAEPLLAKVMELRKGKWGGEHPATLESMTHLAGLYFEQGRLSEAEPLCVASLEIRKRVVGEEHPDTIESMNSLAALYREQGRFADSELLFRQSLEMARRVVGREHVHTLVAMGGLGSLYATAGNYEEAIKMFETKLAILRREFGIAHSWTCTTIEDLADAYFQSDRNIEAMELLQELLDHHVQMATKKDADATTLDNAATRLLESRMRDLQDPEQALEFAMRACSTEESNDGDELWAFLETLASAQHRTGETAKAVETLKRAIMHMPENVSEAVREDLAKVLATYEAASHK